MDRDVRLRGTEASCVRLEHLPYVLNGGDRLVTAVYLAFTGDLDGHVMLAFSPVMARQMAAALLMEQTPSDEELSPMETSALGEVGNITTASFLNAVAEVCHIAVCPSPPFVVQDMVGALLDGIIVEMSMETSYALLLHTTFEVEGEHVEGALILLPSASSYAQLEEYFAACS